MEKEYEIIKKILGEIRPVGETNEDNIRYENLENTIEIVDRLIHDIRLVAEEKDRVEYSISKAGKKAQVFINSLDLNF